MIEYLKGTEVNSEFYEQEFKNVSEFVLRVEKFLRRKKDVIVKCKEQNDLYRRWFDKKNVISFCLHITKMSQFFC